jgi:hypothetical protein
LAVKLIGNCLMVTKTQKLCRRGAQKQTEE